jgi:hypothetical protein
MIGRLLKDDLRSNGNAIEYWTNNGGNKIKVRHIMTATFKGP